MTKKSRILLKQGTLWPALVSVAARALRGGVLLPISTEYQFVEDGGVRFFVRVLTSLARKDEERKRQEQQATSGKAVNPFLPYEKDLFVADVSDTHAAVLNKFNVVEHHLLIVTREFEDQEMLLTPGDFEALWACLMEYHSLGFYNGGEAAGASQSHKHLQMVPLPLSPEGPKIPIEPLLVEADFREGVGTIKGFPFLHAFVRLDSHCFESYGDAAEKTHGFYRVMLRHVGLKAPAGRGAERQSGPYCFLVTRDWMLLVPRSLELFEGISINSLGYAGCLLVRNEEQLDLLKKYGPMTALERAGLPREET